MTVPCYSVSFLVLIAHFELILQDSRIFGILSSLSSPEEVQVIREIHDFGYYWDGHFYSVLLDNVREEVRYYY